MVMFWILVIISGAILWYILARVFEKIGTIFEKSSKIFKQEKNIENERKDKNE